MKKTVQRTVSVLLSILFALSIIYIPADAESPAEFDDEVVYVFADGTGSVNKVTDSVWIEEGEEKELTGSEAGLPVDIKISYTLDGKKTAPEELKGKSGKLTIRVDVSSNRYELKTINGEETKIYVPFMVAGVTAFDGEKASNVSVSSGKSIYDGARYGVAGYAFAGIKEDLDLEDVSLDKLTDVSVNSADICGSIPEYFEITADVTDYESEGMYIVVSNDIFNAIDISGLTGEESLKEVTDKLNGAMDELTGGSEQLCEGMDKLYEGTLELSEGVSKLSNGLDEITSNNDDLVQGAYDVFNAILATANSELSDAGLNVTPLTVSNYDEVLEGAINSLNGTDVYSRVKAGVNDKVRANEATIKEAVTRAVRENVTAQVKPVFDAGVAEQYGYQPEQLIAAGMMTEQQYEALLSAEVDKQMGSADVQALIAQKTEEKIASIADEQMNSDEVKAVISQSNAQVSDGVNKLVALKQQLDDYSRFYNGIIQYTSATAQAADGARKINDSMPELTNGALELKEGSKKLNDGLDMFSEEGIGKVTSFIEDNADGLFERLDAISEVSKGYMAYTDEKGVKKAGVKFIYKIG